jgi:hypothetical protein
MFGISNCTDPGYGPKLSDVPVVSSVLGTQIISEGGSQNIGTRLEGRQQHTGFSRPILSWMESP